MTIEIGKFGTSPILHGIPSRPRYNRTGMVHLADVAFVIFIFKSTDSKS